MFEIENIEDLSIVKVNMDHLDALNAKDLTIQLGNAAELTDKVILDLGNVTFIDSSGLGAIIGFLRSLHEKEGNLKICRVTPHVKVLFKAVRLMQMIDIFDSIDEARKSYKRK